MSGEMERLRRRKLAALISDKYNGDRGAFLRDSGLSKGRLSQLLDEDQPFGDTAARNLEERLHLEPGYFDLMDARTLEFALAFEKLPEHQKTAWLSLVAMLAAPGDR